jgi:DNA-binding NtrC family response regulator
MAVARHVLVIDDDPVIKAILCQTLADTNDYRVEVASNGLEGLKAILRECPDVVLLDVVMPGLDGLEVLKQIRGMHPALPVLMVTGTTDVATFIAAAQRGAFGFIPKPFDPAYVRHLVAAALQNYRAPARC